MHRTLTALALAAAALVAACGSDKAAGPTNVSASGTWNLQTVNGSPLPFTAYQSASGDTLRILGDVFYANPSGTFTDTTNTLRVTLRDSSGDLLSAHETPGSDAFVCD